ncbi:MAG TPA: chemotaxis protein CheD [Thiobacillus sp.]|nr:chemotaxis protein CheD [Thiobacillus sp.]
MMSALKKPSHVTEITLQPGELWFGGENTRIRTILGSCVAVTLWHPRWRIGGMCHYMLPGRIRRMGSEQDGRYGDEALDLLVKEMKAAHSHPHEYEAKLFGGGHMFKHAFCNREDCGDQVPDRNIAAGRELVQRHGFMVKAEQLGGHGHRQVIFDIRSGHAWVKHVPLPEMARCSAREMTR